MNWTLKELVTEEDATFPLGTNEYTLTDIFEDITVMETVGNELYNDCGDIQLKTKTQLTAHSGDFNWLEVLIDNILFGVYEYDVNRYEYDEKKEIYTYRFRSIQKIFFDNLKSIYTQYSSDNTEYNYAFNSTNIKVSGIIISTGNGQYISNDQYTFSLGDIIENLSGKHNNLGFQINSIIQPAKIMNGVYDLPVLWRGLAVPDTVISEADAIDSTFYRMTKLQFNIRNFLFAVTGITTEPTVGAVYSNNVFKFTVSGVTISPTVGSVYSTNSSNYEIDVVDLISGSGYLYATRILGTNDPSAPGTLTKVSGTGDNTISFSAWSYNAISFELIAEDVSSGSGTLSMVRISGTADPYTSGYLRKVSGTGDTKIYFSAWSYLEDMIVSGVEYSSEYTNNGNTYQIISFGPTSVYARRVAGSGTPSSSGYLTKSSGTGDSKIGFSSFNTSYEIFETTWFDILKLIAVIYNCFIYVKASVISGYPNSHLYIDLILKSRFVVTAGGQITVATWIDRILDKNKYEIDNVIINCLNYEYKYLWNVNDGYIFTKDAPAADPGYPNSNYEFDLYVGITEQDTIGTYDYTSPNEVFYEASGVPFIEQYYEDLVGAGDGYTGIMLPTYNDGTNKILKCLDQILFNTSITIQLTSINIGKDFLAKIEGIKI